MLFWPHHYLHLHVFCTFKDIIGMQRENCGPETSKLKCGKLFMFRIACEDLKSVSWQQIQNMLTLSKMNVMDLDALTHGTHKVIIK